MKALQLSAASIALACALSAHADEEITVAAAEIRATAEAEGISRMDGTLLSQAKAVIAAVRQRFASEGNGDDVVVVDINERLAAAGTPAANCARMPVPGSRIREMRCYNPTPGELALNQYQFQEEMRQMRDQQAMRVMQQSQYERVVLEAPTQPPTGNR